MQLRILMCCVAWMTFSLNLVRADGTVDGNTSVAKPNILFIAIDDLRPELGCYGSPIANTPSLDKLASQGLLFNRAYCQQAICRPSRASLMTGTRPETKGLFHNFVALRDLKPDVLTLPQHFIANGYQTAYCGKIFHRGDTDEEKSWSLKPAKNKLKLKKPVGTNREDSMDTDYLLGLNPKNFGEYVVKVKTPEGEWKQVALSKNVQNKNEEKPERAEAIAAIQKSLGHLSEEGPMPSFVGRFVEPVKTHVLRRGSPESKGDEVVPSGLTELEGDLGLDSSAGGKKRRAAFAEWLVQKEHPLTARVMVNRIWHHVFGQGIVTTTSDFGKAGTLPSHPELLDWLASEFVEPTDADPWSMKHMIRMMVMSHAFRQQSSPRSDCLAVDAGAVLLLAIPSQTNRSRGHSRFNCQRIREA